MHASGVIHLARIDSSQTERALCGDGVSGAAVAEVDAADLADLHTFLICPHCAESYLGLGHQVSYAPKGGEEGGDCQLQLMLMG